MTRKDYIEFASMLHGCKPEGEGGAYADQLWCTIVVQTSEIFAADNSRFDEDRFFDACGFQQAMLRAVELLKNQEETHDG